MCKCEFRSGESTAHFVEAANRRTTETLGFRNVSKPVVETVMRPGTASHSLRVRVGLLIRFLCDPPDKDEGNEKSVCNEHFNPEGSSAAIAVGVVNPENLQNRGWKAQRY
jgi:hypothetical protein